ncbi:Uncharacterized protein PECH_006979 [Penicillium ucsense]|uniref:Telomere replication protein EST3 n=1 Tax=Penicillium ucsense TaxID=2839758 RepID=A0A8J8W4M4_9EURO|nr:Uncharacterized protein PECM_005049 [Penicillium ucsense]KAF7739016.1 Uncharacterized protein PECH_006979 [Penicillium ucsense]
MSVPAPWLATYVEQCLAAYTGQTSHESVDIHEEGATIHFKQIGFAPFAAILEWAVGPSNNGAQLMDADNQLQAIFETNSDNQSPLRSESIYNERSPRKHRVQLLDFELTLTHSSPTPDLQLRISKHRILWQEGAIKALTPSKKLRKNQNIKQLLEKILRKVKAKESFTDRQVAPIAHQRLTEASALESSQPSDQQDYGTQSHAVLSQVHRNDYDWPQSNVQMDRRLRHDPQNLLQHLDRPARMISRRARPSSTYSEQTANQESTSNATTNIHGVELDSRRSSSPSKNSISSQPCEEARSELRGLGLDKSWTRESLASCDPKRSAPSATIGPSVHANSHRSVESGRVTSSRKRRHDELELKDDTRSDATYRARVDSPTFTKRQRIEESGPRAQLCQSIVPLPDDAERSHLTHIEQDANGPRTESRPPVQDSWGGQTQISSRDVAIPKDQVELLEKSFCWIPPAPGDPEPRGHVPPGLLQQWNDIARIRHRISLEERDKENDEASRMNSRSSPGSTSSSEIEISTHEDWPSSPVRPPPNRLPESSPVRQASFMPRHAIFEHVDRRRSPNTQPEVAVHDDKLEPSSQVNGPIAATKEAPDKENSEETSSISRSGRMNLIGQAVEIDCDGPQQGTLQDSMVVPNNPNSIPLDRQSAETPLQGPSQIRSNSQTLHLDGFGQYQQDDNDIDDDSSDEESVMENAVPLALGESLPPTQNSQCEQEAKIANQACFQGTKDYVQVVVTPSLGHTRPPNSSESTSKTFDELRPQLSSQSNKNSSQSRVPNTYPFVGSHEKSRALDQSMPESSPPDHVESPMETGIDVPQTQSSGTGLFSQCTTETWTHGLIPESSEPNQCPVHTDRGDSKLLNDPSSQPFTSSASMFTSHPPDSTQGSVMITFANAETESSPRIPPAGDDYTLLARQPQSTSANPREVQDVQERRQGTSATQHADLVAQRAGFLSTSHRSVEAQEVYRKFRADYPNYVGDCTHFTELCAKLQVVRDRGLLQRSKMWDDFVIKHLQAYMPYLDDCETQMDPSPLDYETYFVRNFPKTVNKKRSLSGYSIALVASERHSLDHMTSTQADSPVNSVPTTGPKQTVHDPLTESFVDKFSNLQARSFTEPVENGLPLFEDDAHLLSTQAPSSIETTPFSVQVKVEGTATENPGHYHEMLGVHLDPPSTYMHIPALGFNKDHRTESPDAPIQALVIPGRNDDIPMVEAEPTTGENEEVANTDVDQDPDEHDENETANTKDQASSETGGEELDVEPVAAPEQELEADDSRHETASVELGDDTFLSARSPLSQDEIPETQPEDEHGDGAEQKEWASWFSSLRRTWDKGGSETSPVWSDDRNTPFKSWAEADQNVLGERRRRGGAKILLDEKGVIRRSVNR